MNVADIISAGQKQSGEAEKEDRGNEGKGIHESVKHNMALCYCMWNIESFEFDDICSSEKNLKYLEEKRNYKINIPVYFLQ